MKESSRLSDCSRFCFWAATVEPMADVNWTVVRSFIHRCELCDLVVVDATFDVVVVVTVALAPPAAGAEAAGAGEDEPAAPGPVPAVVSLLLLC